MILERDTRGRRSLSKGTALQPSTSTRRKTIDPRPPRQSTVPDGFRQLHLFVSNEMYEALRVRAIAEEEGISTTVRRIIRATLRS
jgi:hypothetical protein